MNEFDKQQLIKPFLKKRIDGDFESDQDKMVLYVLSTLLEETNNQEDAVRSIGISIDSDAEFAAYSRKLSNILQLKNRAVWVKILSKAVSPIGLAAGTMVFGLPEQLKLAAGILSFMALTIDKGLTVEFNEQDAMVLYAIYRLGKTFSKGKLLRKLEELRKEYPNKFVIPENLIDRSLKKFIKYRVLSDDVRDDIYVIIEDVNVSDK